MHDQNGSPSWHAPSPWDVMRELSHSVSSVMHSIGGVETGQKMLAAELSTVRSELHDGLATVHGRITDIEKEIAAAAQPTSPPASGQPPAAPAASRTPGTLEQLKDLANSLRDLVTAIMPLGRAMVAAALALASVLGALAPEETRGLLRWALPGQHRPAAAGSVAASPWPDVVRPAY